MPRLISALTSARKPNRILTALKSILTEALPETDLLTTLRQYWGYDSFRPQQERVVRSILAGRDVAVIMPTGGGKSLCYQLPAILSGGTAVVISPLIALMHDQAAQLAQMGIPAAVLNSTLSGAEQSRVMMQATQGAYRLLYLSPERLARPDTFGWLSRIPISFFAIDEAHCISEWGHEFRPEYRMLNRLREQFPDIPVAAFTASATQRVRHDILAQLQLRQPEKVILSFDRPNLRYLVREVDERTQERLLLRAVQAHAGSNVIIYAPTILRVEQTVDFLNENSFAAVGYHGKMTGEVRKRNQELWVSDEAPVLVGTIAFGMGINKPNVRTVIHLSLPKSLEQYYQEAGRAGRDGEPADCALLWQRKDAGLLAYFIEEMRDPKERERSWESYSVMRRFVEGVQCRHRQICLHFGETPKWTSCGMCDICAALPEWLTSHTASSPNQNARTVKTAADPDLFALLAEWRIETARKSGVPAYVILNDASLADLCVRKPGTREELLDVFGIGAKKAELYGPELLATLAAYAGGRRATPRQSPVRKTSPSIHTLELLREGRSIEEIAVLDGRQVATIVERVSVLIESGMIGLQPAWVAPDRVEIIKLAACEHGFERLKPIKDALPPDYTYDEIRLVVASLRQGASSEVRTPN
jgi:ATP-dependent DNA helicase RecQ